MALTFSPQILEKYSNIAFPENESSCSMSTDPGMDMTLLIVGFCSFSEVPKNVQSINIFLMHVHTQEFKKGCRGSMTSVRS